MSRSLLPAALRLYLGLLKRPKKYAGELSVSSCRQSSSICAQCRSNIRRQCSKAIVHRRSLTQQVAALSDSTLRNFEHSTDTQAEQDTTTAFISRMATKHISGLPLSMSEYHKIITVLWTAKDYDSALTWYWHALEPESPQPAHLPTELPHHAIAFHLFCQLSIRGARKKRALLVKILPSESQAFQAALIDRIRKELINTLAERELNRKPQDLLQSFATTVHGLRGDLQGSISFQSYVTFARIANQNGLYHFSLGDIEKSFRLATKQNLVITRKSCFDVMDIYAVGRDDSGKCGDGRRQFISNVQKYMSSNSQTSGMAHKYLLKTLLNKKYNYAVIENHVERVEECMKKHGLACTSDTLKVLIRAVSHGFSPFAIIHRWEKYAFTLPHREPSLYATMLHACAALDSNSNHMELLPRYAVTKVLEQMERDLGTASTPSIATGLLRCYMKLEGGLVNVERLLVQADEWFKTVEQRSEWINKAVRYLLVNNTQHDHRYPELACRWVLGLERKDWTHISGRQWTSLMKRVQSSAMDSARMFQYYSRAMSKQNVGEQKTARWDSLMLARLAQALHNEPELLANYSAKLPFFASNLDAKAITRMPIEELWILLDEITKSKSTLT